MFKKSAENNKPIGTDLESIQNRLSELKAQVSSIPHAAVTADPDKTAELWDRYTELQTEIAQLEALEKVALHVRAEHQKTEAIKQRIAKIAENNQLITDIRPVLQANRERRKELEAEVRDLEKEAKKLANKLGHAHQHNIDLQTELTRQYDYPVPPEDVL